MSQQVCGLYRSPQGCRYGERCKYLHVVLSQSKTVEGEQAKAKAARNSRHKLTRTTTSHASTPSSSTAIATTNAESSASKRIKRGEQPCFSWRKGDCPKGDKCFYAHDPAIKEAIERARRLAEQDIQEKARRECEARERAEAERKLEQERQEAETRRQLLEDRRRLAEVFRRESLESYQCVVDGSIVTFKSGLQIQSTITGFEACRITIQNLPMDVKQDEITALFAQQGLDMTKYHLVGVQGRNGKKEATVVTDAESGEAITAGLEDIELRGERLTFELGVFNGKSSMGVSTANDADLLVITCHGPSVSYVIDIPAYSLKGEIVRLNGVVIQGRKVKAERNTLPPGRFIRSFNENSIKLRNLPLQVHDADIIALTGHYTIRRLKPTTSFDANVVVQLLHQQLRNLAIAPPITFEVISKDNEAGLIKVRARFATHEAARKARDLIEGTRNSQIGSKIWTYLRNPFLYTITLPKEQYYAQKTLWDDLVAGLKDRKLSSLRIHEQNNGFRIQVAGNDKAATGALKVRVECLAAGEKVDGWHVLLAQPRRQVLNAIKDKGAFLRSDARLQVIRLYGRPKAVEEAREIVMTELKRLASEDFSITLQQRAVIGYLVREGIATFQEMFGPESISLDVSRCQVTIRGPEEARHHLNRLIQDASRPEQRHLPAQTSDDICPVCYDTVSFAYPLGCGHVYCTSCLHHFLMNAVETKRFPLVCAGNEATCNAPITIPLIRRFLPAPAFDKLLNVAFDDHILQHSSEFQSCNTPDCAQIYRRTTAAADVQCPSCFSVICSACGLDGHESKTKDCKEWRNINDRGEQERLHEEWLARQAGVRRCPSCSVLVEKIEGCNHMTCHCGTHFCWRCLQICDVNEIYNHMTEKHGNMYDPDPPPAPEELIPPANLIMPGNHDNLRPIINWIGEDPRMDSDDDDANPWYGVDLDEQAEELAHYQRVHAMRVQAATQARRITQVQAQENLNQHGGIVLRPQERGETDPVHGNPPLPGPQRATNVYRVAQLPPHVVQQMRRQEEAALRDQQQRATETARQHREATDRLLRQEARRREEVRRREEANARRIFEERQAYERALQENFYRRTDKPKEENTGWGCVVM